MKLFLLAALAFAQGPTPLHRVKSGDVLTVVANGTSFGGDYQVLDDGAIYGVGFGRVQVGGKTWAEAQNAIRAALTKFVRAREISLAIKTQQPDNVYLIGPSGKGEIPYRPKLTLRQVLSNTPVDSEADLTEVQVFRAGQPIAAHNLGEIVGKSDVKDLPLYPDDVITLSPVAFLRVWVTGSVKSPGLMRVLGDADPYQAVAAAGGFLREADAPDPLEDDRIVVRRGDQTIELPARFDAKAPKTRLQAGDAVTVLPALQVRFSVAGEVVRPGEYTLRGAPDVSRALASAGGPTREATLRDVVVVHQGEMTRIDLTPLHGHDGAVPHVPLGLDDLVVVPRNLRQFYVFGEVEKPGPVVMEDEKTYRLSDALAAAGGLSGRGVMRRISLARPDANGKYVVTQYNLDEFLKDGKTAANPELRPGDMVLFGQSKGLSISSAMQALSAAFLFQSLTRLGR